ncbi:p21-activated protein kinase-interacting protein 1-like [Chiloscyllium plagiosum]|uniref:p21-activated protein kinase-interacting protein 1-like n=1 Tax=Chiloscyllium plagiosum TaxID=36176 RepID=UPI001CB7F7DF|nr:p21-activated protein kinase-interacting protein 1-like [Chiloscyllium plagiosum]
MDVETGTDSELVLIGGCYEQIIFGYRIKKPGQNWNPEPDFTHHAHTASLTTVAINDCYVATGSKDETIQLYNMKKKIDQGSLLYHDGTITCLEFYGNTHLLSGAEDGLICVWDIKRWVCLKTIRAHKQHVRFLSCSDNARGALPRLSFYFYRTWNLIDGKSAFIKNINRNAHIVQWSPAGDNYIVISNNELDVYNLVTASIHGTIVCKTRISSVKFIMESIVAIAGDEEYVRLYNTNTKACLSEFKAHDTRVKVMHFFSVAQSHVLATASSDGYIKLWQIDIKKIQSCPVLLSKVNTSARLTCLAVWLSIPQSIAQRTEELVTQCEGDKSSIKLSKQKEVKFKEATLDGGKHPQKRKREILYKREKAVETKEKRKKRLQMNTSQ